MKLKSISILLLFLTSILSAQDSFYNVKQLIPKASGENLITHELQAIIDKCAAQGGGKVFFPAGEYLIGSIFLRSNTYLDLAAGATIYGSTDINQYLEEAEKTLIYAKGAQNFGIIGHGTLNGNGDFFWRGKERPYDRPNRFMLFDSCQHIKISDIKMLNSPNWNLELLNCDFAWIEGVTMISDFDAPNSDGIDPTSSSNIFISNCFFELGDDAICPKSRGTKPTENVVVQNCIISSEDSAIKLGTRSEAPIRNLVFSNIIIRNSEYGIAFFAKDGGTFENIRFSNITIESTLESSPSIDKPSGSYPIFLDIERRKPDGPISYIRDVHFSDITINTKDGHCLFLGQPDQHIEQLYFSNVTYHLDKHLPFTGKKKPRGVRSLTDRAANDYSHIPANFAFAHVSNIRIDNLHIKDHDVSGLHERHMIWGYDVHNLVINRFTNQIKVANQALAQLQFKNATGIEVSTSQPTHTGSPFLHLEGDLTRDVILFNNNFSQLDQIITTDSAIDHETIIQFNNVKK